MSNKYQRSDVPKLTDFKNYTPLTNKNIFKLTKENLIMLFESKNIKVPDNQGECRMSLNILKDCGYINGLCSCLNTDPDNGIQGNQIDLLRREQMFGKNQIALPKIKSFFYILSQQFEDSNIQILQWAATIYLIFSIFGDQPLAYIESLTIYSGLFFQSFVAAFCQWIQENQFLKLKDQVNDQRVSVYRGAHGTVQSIAIRDLVVGDVIDLQQGDRVPADCIIIDEMNISTDQSMYNKKQKCVLKSISKYFGQDAEEENNHKEHPDPFLFSNSKILTGSGKAVVCCVGKSTKLSRLRNQQEYEVQQQQTFLEEKLEQTAKQIGKYAIFATFLSFATQALFLIFLIIFNKNEQFFSNSSLLKVGKIAITAVVILIVSIPEGLPLAIKIAMALSVDRLKEDGILIKNLESIQTCATLHEVCVGKTGTLTKGELHIQQVQLFKDSVLVHDDSTRNNNQFYQNEDYSLEIKDIIFDAIISNSDVRIEIDDFSLKYVPKGNLVEVGMIEFLMDNNQDVQQLLIQRNLKCPKISYLSFDQVRKTKVIVRKIDNYSDYVRIYVKGAPEKILLNCSQTLSDRAQKTRFSKEDAYQILSDVISKQMAQNGLKVISYAYKDLEIQEYNQLLSKNDIEDDKFRNELEKDLIYLGSFGLNDQIRENVYQHIHLIKYGHTDINSQHPEQSPVNIRLVSGDHIETAKYVALSTGILSQTEFEREDSALTGEQFRSMIGGYKKVWDNQLNEYRIDFSDRSKFDKVKKNLRVIARATPEDRLLVVCGIKQKGGLIGMAGSSIADADALKKADVGFCMGNGCDVAKDNSDLIILNNDFFSIQRSIKWGRSIFDNVRKFLQFQLTINLSIVIITILGGATLGHTPLNVIQMLWINLIMDILGAIALGTEPARKECQVSEENRQKRVSRSDKIMLKEMWRQILIQVCYQILVMIILMYFGGLIFFKGEIDLVYTPLRNPNGQPTHRMTLDTIIFHTFVIMNLFNQINCRIIDSKEINIFKTLLNNPMFWIVLLLELGIQQSMINFSSSKLGSALLGTAPLSASHQIVCWILGSLSLLVNLLLKHIPEELFKFTDQIDIETEDGNEHFNRFVGQAELKFQQVSDDFYKAK